MLSYCIMTNANQFPDRATWQRSEGMVLFSELTAEILPELGQNITDSDLDTVLRHRAKDDSLFHTAFEVSGLLNTAHIRLGYYAKCAEPNAYVTQYTFAKNVEKAFSEGLMTAANFPLNLMMAANEQFLLRSNGSPMYDSLGKLVTDMRSDWFHSLCGTAGFTRNGLWGPFSTEDNCSSTTDGTTETTQLRFLHDDRGNYSYTFSDTADDMLRKELKNRNQYARRRLKAAAMNQTGPVTEVWDTGTTSGCPVRHLEPHYPSDELAEISLGALSIQLHRSSNELVTKRDKSGISLGLDTLADLLDRAQTILDRTSI